MSLLLRSERSDHPSSGFPLWKDETSHCRYVPSGIFSPRRNGIITGARITLITKEIITGITILNHTSLVHYEHFFCSVFLRSKYNTFSPIQQTVIPHASPAIPGFCHSVLLSSVRISVFLYPQIRQHILKNRFHHRGCYRSAAIDSLRIIDDTDPEDHRIVRRAKPRKEGNIPVGTSWKRLGSGCFPADPIAPPPCPFFPPSFTTISRA